MEEIIKLDTVGLYNKLYGVETLHPLVSVVDASEIKQDLPANVTLNYGLYALYLKQTKCGDLRYGRQLYDYQEGTVTSFAPGQVVEIRRDTNVRPQWQGLVFHPDLIRGTSLGQDIKQYSFFSYASNEALHLSDEEKSIYRDCLEKIKMELARPVDKHSRRLIVRNIELLLDYCTRYYERQFITRENKNKALLENMERLFVEYIASGRLQGGKLPTSGYMAGELDLSVAYFDDLLKFETGKTLEEYLQLKRLDIARHMLLQDGHTPAAVARKLGYPNVQCFSVLFKKITGVAPSDYRLSQN